MTIFFESTREARAWFAANHKKARALKIGFRTRPNGHACISLSEARAVAMCFGWNAGRKTAIDSGTHAVAFKPISEGERWKADEAELAETLIEAKRMTPAGRAAFKARAVSGAKASGNAAPAHVALSPLMLAELKRHPIAWSCFQRTPPSQRQTWSDWVMSPKQEETRSRRFAKLLLDLSRPRA